MHQETNLGTLVGVTIRVGLPCQCGCGETAMHDMSVVDARQYATSVLAACDGLSPGIYPTMGSDA